MTLIVNSRFAKEQYAISFVVSKVSISQPRQFVLMNHAFENLQLRNFQLFLVYGGLEGG